MCIRDRPSTRRWGACWQERGARAWLREDGVESSRAGARVAAERVGRRASEREGGRGSCLLYTSDAADDM
eukprot:8327909-Alexandrium_andersonii.AAC.1